MSFTALFTAMASMFAAMAVGFAGARLRLIDEDFDKKLTKLLLTMIHPCMILSSVMGVQHLLTNGQVFKLFGVGALCYAALIPLSWLLVRLLRVPAGDRGTYRYMLVFSNLGYMGYPLVEALFGADARFHMTIFVLLFQLVNFTYGIHLLSEGEHRFRFGLEFFRRPSVLAAFAAVVIYLIDLPIPDVVTSVFQYVGAMATPLSMVILGCSLAFIPVHTLFGSGRIYALVAVKLLLIPAAAGLLLRYLLPDPLLLGIATISLSTPIAANATILALAYGGNQKLASSGVFLSTIFSIFTIPAIMWLLFLR